MVKRQLFSFLNFNKISRTFSDWITLRGGIPRGPGSGRWYAISTDSFPRLRLLTHKVGDDTVYHVRNNL